MTRTAASDIPATDTDLIHDFTGQNGDYYARAFQRLGEARNFAWTFNWAAALLGPIWMGARNLWGVFWPFLMLEMIAVVQLGRGLFGELGAEQLARAERLTQQAAVRLQQAQQAAEAGAANADALKRVAESFQRGAAEAQAAADAAAAFGPRLLMLGAGLLLLIKLLEGCLANWLLEKRYLRWRSDHSIAHGIQLLGALGGALLMFVVYPITTYRFGFANAPEWLKVFPADRAWNVNVSNMVDGFIEWFTRYGEVFFDSIRNGVQVMLDALEVALVGTPWPVTMLLIVVLAWRLAGVRVAIFTAAALAYLALLGFWEKSMTTVALLGTAALICIVLGIPLGVLCARSSKLYAVVRPILDFMQTMPAFVYLIPVIAFFGTGKPPGIVATLIFGMPPVVRLTVLGIRGVPHSVREAALAFGASKRFLLWKVDLPLAMPSIMAGINQTIMMCLSMVVIASLIGAKGLGEDVLEALQYAAEGQGIVAGLAILFCAMVLDRIVQGKGTKPIH